MHLSDVHLNMVMVYFNCFLPTFPLILPTYRRITTLLSFLRVLILVNLSLCYIPQYSTAQGIKNSDRAVSITSKKRSEISKKPISYRFHGSNGLPSTTNVFEARVDSRGYAWFATAGGVGRYNGYEFQSYRHEDGLADQLAVRSYEDYKGRIWFTSISGKLSYFQNGRVHQYKYNSVLTPYLDRDMLSSIYVDTNDMLHIGTYLSGYITVSSKGKLSRLITDSTHNGIGIVIINDTIPLCFTNGSIADQSQVTLFLEGTEKEQVFNIEAPHVLPYNKTVRCIALANGKFLLSSRDRVIYFSPKSKEELYRFSENVIAINEDSHGAIWIGTDGKGVYQYSNGLSKTHEPVNYFPGNTITSICEDSENGIWVTSITNGAYYLPTPYISSIEIGKLFEPSPYSNDRIVWPSKRNQEIYLLSRKGLLMYSEGSNLHTVDLQKTLHGSSNLFSSLYLPPNDQSIWVSGNNGYSQLLGNTVFYPKNETEIQTIGLSMGSCYSTQDSSFWTSRNYWLFHIKGDRIDKYLKFDHTIRCITEMQDGSLWIGASNGLWKYENDSLSFLGESDSLLASPVLSIIEFKGSLWIGNQRHGLVRLMEKKYSSVVTSGNLVLKSPHAFYIRNDEFWFISEGHLNKLSFEKDVPDSLQLQFLDLPRSLWGSNVVTMTEWLDKLTILGNSLIYQFEYIPEFRSGKKIPLHVCEVRINNRDTSLAQEFTLGHHQDHISIKYLGITNHDAKYTKYKYRIKGIDPNWIETTDRQVQYTSLPPGTHIFELFVKPINEPWTKKPVTVSFTIAPPYWETWWFIFLCSLIVISMIWVAVGYRFRRIRKENALQMALNESQQQALSARMNPHFIFNALNSIKTFVLENDTIRSNDYIARFSKLMRQILDQSQYTLVPLEDELKALDNYVSLELMRGKDRFSYSIDVDQTIDPKWSMIPSLLLQPFVENAIWHGIMPLDRKGQISVSIKRKGDWIICSIEDNGVGRENLGQNTQAHQSASTQISTRRLELINKRFGTQIDIQIHDLKDENGLAIGTKVDIPIPIEFKQ